MTLTAAPLDPPTEAPADPAADYGTVRVEIVHATDHRHHDWTHVVPAEAHTTEATVAQWLADQTAEPVLLVTEPGGAFAYPWRNLASVRVRLVKPQGAAA
jgi:hypothetical protein